MKRAASGIVPVLAIDRNAPKALHRQIYDAYRNAIVERRLHPRQRIPSSRMLASELGVSRFPVLNAYAQLLAEGYIESRVGSGTVVSSSMPDQPASSRSPGTQCVGSPAGPRPVSRRSSLFPRLATSPWLGGLGAFGVGQVDFDHFPLRLWSSLLAQHCRNMDAQSFRYGDQKGSKALREAIAGYLRTARSLHCQAEQIMIVSGSQQALEI